jgi:zinc/manganese transport system ATP-binding protein
MSVGGDVGAGDVLVARSLHVRLGGRTVLDGVDLNVRAGSFTGLIGVNGAGKTTLLRALMGMVTISGGSVSRPARTTGPGGIGYVPQKAFLDEDTPLRARDVVALGLDGGRLGLPLRRRRDRAVIDASLAAVGATSLADRRVGLLSGGQQQRVLIAHALVSDPALLLLDEPLAALDPSSVVDVVALLDRLRRDRGTAIVMTSHDVTPLTGVLDRVVYLADGRAVTGSPSDVLRSDVLTRLYGQEIEVVDVAGRVLVLPGRVGKGGAS